MPWNAGAVEYGNIGADGRALPLLEGLGVVEDQMLCIHFNP